MDRCDEGAILFFGNISHCECLCGRVNAKMMAQLLWISHSGIEQIFDLVRLGLMLFGRRSCCEYRVGNCTPYGAFGMWRDWGLACICYLLASDHLFQKNWLYKGICHDIMEAKLIML